ncbi:MAG: aryl-sulfate sulfotransferase [Chitinophagales bacterium]|nr:aryl-sulfate sulfotransferase [Chitinophagales bacterium]
MAVLFLLTVTYTRAQIQFIAPLSGSKYHNPERNIIIRPGALINLSSVQPYLFQIKGSLSGEHEFKLNVALDSKTIVLNPLVPFSYGEEVTVTLQQGVKQADGKTIEPYSFSFFIHRQYTPEEQQRMVELRNKSLEEEFIDPKQQDITSNRTANPYYSILKNTTPASGNVFFSNFSFLGYDTQRLWIIKNSGDSVYSLKSNSKGFDWKLNFNHYLTSYASVGYDEFDSNYVKIKTFNPANGYSADVHEFLIYPDGHHYMLTVDNEIVDMTVYDPSYQPEALVIGNAIQEFDANDNLIFEWRTIDHIDVPEALHENLANGSIDATHANSMDEDTDGNLIVSFRHLDQVDKINVNNGSFIWRLGGVKNQFTFTNDPAQFNYQHHCLRIANGNITLFDNNVWGTPDLCYAKEYQLDEVKKKATLVWSYNRPAVNGVSMTSFAMGSVQRQSNGNTLIGWGKIPLDSGLPSMTEVDANNNIVWEMEYDPTYYDITYRALRYNWNPCARPSTQLLNTSNIATTSAKLNWNDATGAVKYYVEYRKKGNTNWTSVKISSTKHSYTVTGLSAGKNYEWHVQTWCDKNGNKKSNFTPIITFKTDAQKVIDETGFNDISIYPNPAHDFMHLRWTANNENTTSAIITDVAGRILKSWNLKCSYGENDQTISLTDISPGIYFIKVLTPDQQQLQKIVIE